MVGPEHDGALANIAGAHREEQKLYEMRRRRPSLPFATHGANDESAAAHAVHDCALFIGDDVEGY